MCSNIHVWGEPDSWTRSIDANRSFRLSKFEFSKMRNPTFRNSSFRCIDFRISNFVFVIVYFRISNDKSSNFRISKSEICVWDQSNFPFRTSNVRNLQILLFEIRVWLIDFRNSNFEFSIFIFRTSNLQIPNLKFEFEIVRIFNFGIRGFDFRNSHLP